MATDMEGSIAVAKGTSMVFLGGAAFVVTLLPVFINRRVNKRDGLKDSRTYSEFVLSLFLSFGGGVLLCTTFLHLLPEVTENIETLITTGKIPEGFPLPLPELIMCCGFFTMYIVEEVVHKFLHSRQEKKNTKKGCDNPLNLSAVLDSELSLKDTYKEILKQDMFQVTFSPPHEEDVKIIAGNTRHYGSSMKNLTEEVNHNHDHYHDGGHDLHYDHDHSPHDHDHDHHHHDHHTMVTDKAPSLRELLIVLALTVHEGFEGLAIGLESSVAAVWYLMTAVAVHKCVIAFCIGVELVSGKVSLPLSVFYAAIYSFASPFGIALGLLLTSSAGDESSVLLSVILQGMATGTLLYVVFFEILKRDGHNGSGLAQMVTVIVGFVCMAILTVLLDA